MITKETKLVNVRAAYARKLIEKAKERSDFLVLDCDSKEPTKISEVYKEHPDLCISFGIAEQNMISAAAGIATMGYIPFVNSFAQFLSMRGLDQIRNSIAYPNLNVKLVACHYGLDVGKDGVTHQTIEDISIMRAIPNMTILNPADDIECEKMVDFCFRHNGPIYLRTGKSSVPRIYQNDYSFRLGSPRLIADGNPEISVLVTGNIFYEVIEAFKGIEAHGLRPQLINIPCLKPLNEQELVDLTRNAKIIFTIEDHNILGGLGSIVSEILSKLAPKKVCRLGVNDSFAEAGERTELFEKYGLGIANIIESILGECGRSV